MRLGHFDLLRHVLAKGFNVFVVCVVSVFCAVFFLGETVQCPWGGKRDGVRKRERRKMTRQAIRKRNADGLPVCAYYVCVCAVKGKAQEQGGGRPLLSGSRPHIEGLSPLSLSAS